MPGSFDSTRVEEMIELFGADTFGEIVDEFAREVDEAMARLDQLVEAGDVDEILKVLHLLRGCAANLGADRIVALAESTRARLNQQRPITSITEFSRFRTVCDGDVSWICGLARSA